MPNLGLDLAHCPPTSAALQLIASRRHRTDRACRRHWRNGPPDAPRDAAAAANYDRGFLFSRSGHGRRQPRHDLAEEGGASGPLVVRIDFAGDRRARANGLAKILQRVFGDHAGQPPDAAETGTSKAEPAVGPQLGAASHAAGEARTPTQITAAASLTQKVSRCARHDICARVR